MIYVGIDVAKDKHDVHIKDDQGCVLVKHLTIPNNRAGFNQLLATIARFETDPEQTKIGLESTGNYSDNLRDCLVENSKIVYVLNPSQVNNFRKGLSLRNTKTDAVDAKAITDAIMCIPGLKPYCPEVYHKKELKSLTRFLNRRKGEAAKQKIFLSKWVAAHFPELTDVKKEIHCATIYALLEKYPGPKQIARANEKTLKNLIKKASHGACKEELALAIRTAAADSIGHPTEADSFELRLILKEIKQLQSQIKEIEEEILEISTEEERNLGTIVGVSQIQGISIAAEIGDINRFSTPDKLLAYAGMSPTKSNSGKKQNSKGHIEKHGSKYLRNYLYESATLIWKHNKIFEEYYNKKTGEGKHFNVVVSHMVRKLVRIIFAMMKSGESYRIA